MAWNESLGFIGLGVMGGPMCRNLARKLGRPVIAYDTRPERVAALAEHGVGAAGSVAEVAREAAVVFLSLPDGEAVEAVCAGEDGLLAAMGRGGTLVDLGTSPVALARDLAARFAERGIAFADAPVARTRAAAEAGTLSIMVGASAETFARLAPLLACMGSEVTRCGEIGAGQVVKLLNNMVLFQTVAALAEALSIGRRAGVDGEILFATLAKGSADSFALRNHGMKSMLPGRFPGEAFSTGYALKDLRYALDLAEGAGIDAAGAKLTRTRLEQAIAAGFGDVYFPALINVIAPGEAA